MPFKSRAKGLAFENEVRREVFETHGYTAYRCDQSSQHHGESDLIVEAIGAAPRLRIECKNDKRIPGITHVAAFDQANGVCDGRDVPAVVAHVHGRGPGRRGGRLITMDLADFMPAWNALRDSVPANNGAGADHGDDDGGSEQIKDVI